MTGSQKNIVDNEAMIVQGYCLLNLLTLGPSPFRLANQTHPKARNSL